MKEAQFVSILAPPRLDSCAVALKTQDLQLSMVFALSGNSATSFAKDLEAECKTWLITSPEELHQKILDLLSSVRQKNLEIELALCWLSLPQIVFSTYSGEIILKRNGVVKKLLFSQGEIKLIVGNFRENDQIVLSNLLSANTLTYLTSLLESEISTEKLIGELTLLRQEQEKSTDSVVFVNYVDSISQEIESKKGIDWQIITRKIISVFKKIGHSTKKIYKSIKKQGRRKILIALSILVGLALLIVGINSLINYQQAKAATETSRQITAIKGEETDFAELLLSKPLEARERANQQLQALQALRENNNNKTSLDLINAEIASLEKLIADISAENSLDQLTVSHNLGNFLAQKMIMKDGNIFLLENNNQDILWIKNDQTKETLRLPDNNRVRDLTFSEGKLFVLSQGIWLLDLNSSDRQFNRIKVEGESDRAAEIMQSYGPYLYLLNKEKRNIYRYHYNDDELSEPIGWLIDKQGISFENLSDVLVDGDLWVSSKDGEILKFSRGSKLEWQIAGLKDLPDSSLLLAQNENANQLAALEKQKRRLLLLTKEGQLISEIKSNELAGVTSLAFDQSGQKLYALSGSVIYELNLLK